MKMETPKRQKWLDVYDEATGTYTPQRITGGTDEQSPAVKSQDQVPGQSINEDVTKAQKNEHDSSHVSGPITKPDHSPQASMPETLASGDGAMEDTVIHHAILNSASPSPLDDEERVAEHGSPSTAPKTNENQNWNATSYDRVAANEHYYGSDFYDESYTSGEPHPETLEHVAGYIKGWVQTTHEVVANLHPPGIKEPESRGVSTETGALMKPIEHPAELNVKHRVKGVDRSTEDNINHANRSAHKAAQHKIAIDTLKPETENDDLRAKGCPGYPFYSAEKMKDPQKATIQPKMVSQEGEAKVQEKVNPREIKIPVHLRPAFPKDMPQIAKIYNMEIGTTPALQDKRPVTASEFRELYEDACKNNLPFIVAVKGWFGPAKDVGPVIGFAVMDTAIKGIMGSRATHAEGAGKLTVVVDRGYRRLNICSAMIDAILYCCSVNYTARLGYQIVNPNNDRTLMKPMYNPRQWNSIDIEVVVWTGTDKKSAEADPRYKWISEYLDKYFQMSLVSRDVAIYKVNNKWFDRVTFRHRCRPTDS
ncbi:hypothetical protein F4805DRAFT_168942 [Annulohypoxylon moriforme]|nr:hypothetical protein F4805DRAFT_168942 [Annulohypoxylon moriforme]